MAQWHKELPEDLLAEPTLLKYETQEAANRGLVEANSRLGNSMRILGEDASNDERIEWHKKLLGLTKGELVRVPDPTDEQAMAEHRVTMGVPAEQAGYDNPEGFDGLPDEILSFMQEASLGAGLSKNQYKSIITSMASMHKTEQDALNGNETQAAASLKAEWGLAHEERIAITDRLAEQFAPEGMDLNPQTRKVLYKMGEALAGRGPQAGYQPYAPTNKVDPLEAQEQIAELTRKMSSTNPADRGEYKRNMARMAKLQKLAHPHAAR